MTHIQGCTNARNDGYKLPLSQPLQAAGPERIDPSNANVWWANAVETDGAQSSGQTETVDGEVENMLRSVRDLIKTSEGSNTSGNGVEREIGRRGMKRETWETAGDLSLLIGTKKMLPNRM
ncbi:hypothetical protein CRENBAI_005172 [Crenichthys baileyi]|uniref:Uncharacterized protein n=1 Tax=Crenichthys baileyi TaxID=28760 RepID=A0AAV9SM27_9TELE